MKYNWNQRFIKIGLFLLTAIIIILSFPSVEKYKFEYELQRPWRYQNLIAPFDFMIYKTDAEIQTEADSLRKNLRPIYSKSIVSNKDISTQVYQIIKQSSQMFDLLTPANISTDSIKQYVAHLLIDNMMDIYQKGVIQLPSDIEWNEQYELMIIEGNIAVPYSLTELLTPLQAYKQTTDFLLNTLNHTYSGLYNHVSNENQQVVWYNTLIQRLPINEIIKANIKFDIEGTQAELKQRISNMATTQGKVMAGQRIIGTGDIVDKKAARIIDSLSHSYNLQIDTARTQLPIFIGEALITSLLLLSVYLFLHYFRSDVLNNIRSLCFILFFMTFFIVCSSILSARHDNITFIVPYTILPIVVRLFLDSRIAMYLHTITMCIISFMAHNSQLFLLLHIPVGMIAIVSIFYLTRRFQLLRTAMLVLAYYFICYWSYTIWQTGSIEDSWQPVPFSMLIINSIFIMLSYPALYVFERIFGFVSDVTLLELSDTNTPLLRELSEKAPGTFQHSIQVANLAQEVAYHIRGTNAMLVRTGAMYHDIGKINAPYFFTENQQNGINPHSTLDLKESAQIIIRHVADGIAIARKHQLPQQVINIIKSHHGNAQAKYFYITWQNQHQGEFIDKNEFSYPGPIPTTKEEAICMICDAVEASSKSLQNYTDEAIDTLVEKIVNSQIEDNLLNMAPLTFHDIEVCKQVLKEKLKNIYHARIQYPELKKA